MANSKFYYVHCRLAGLYVVRLTVPMYVVTTGFYSFDVNSVGLLKLSFMQ